MIVVAKNIYISVLQLFISRMPKMCAIGFGSMPGWRVLNYVDIISFSSGKVNDS